MKTRQAVIFTGARFRVPEHIQRIDTGSTHGWQLRYGKSRMFSDGTPDGKGARAALLRAIDELRKRINKLPAPTGLQREVSANKSNDLPVGISGPILRQRKDRKVPECSFSVLLPQFGDKPLRRSVYIGSQTTYTAERYKIALDRAMAMRKEAEEAYQAAATKHKRQQAKKL